MSHHAPVSDHLADFGWQLWLTETIQSGGWGASQLLQERSPGGHPRLQLPQVQRLYVALAASPGMLVGFKETRCPPGMRVPWGGSAVEAHPVQTSLADQQTLHRGRGGHVHLSLLSDPHRMRAGTRLWGTRLWATDRSRARPAAQHRCSVIAPDRVTCLW